MSATQNKRLERLFLKALDKPQYQNQIHSFGPYSFMFHKVDKISSNFIRNEENGKRMPNLFTISGYYITLYQFGNKLIPYQHLRHEGFVESIIEVVPKMASNFLKLDTNFVEEFITYLKSVELHDRLQRKLDKKPTTKINKI